MGANHSRGCIPQTLDYRVTTTGNHGWTPATTTQAAHPPHRPAPLVALAVPLQVAGLLLRVPLWGLLEVLREVHPVVLLVVLLVELREVLREVLREMPRGVPPAELQAVLPVPLVLVEHQGVLREVLLVVLQEALRGGLQAVGTLAAACLACPSCAECRPEGPSWACQEVAYPEVGRPDQVPSKLVARTGSRVSRYCGSTASSFDDQSPPSMPSLQARQVPVAVSQLQPWQPLPVPSRSPSPLHSTWHASRSVRDPAFPPSWPCRR